MHESKKFGLEYVNLKINQLEETLTFLLKQYSASNEDKFQIKAITETIKRLIYNLLHKEVYEGKREEFVKVSNEEKLVYELEIRKKFTIPESIPIVFLNKNPNPFENTLFPESFLNPFNITSSDIDQTVERFFQEFVKQTYGEKKPNFKKKDIFFHERSTGYYIGWLIVLVVLMICSIIIGIMTLMMS